MENKIENKKIQDWCKNWENGKTPITKHESDWREKIEEVNDWMIVKSDGVYTIMDNCGNLL